MACKRISAGTVIGQHNFATERKILERFKECTVSNENIMQSFATFTHGDNFLILSPWAEGRDLNIFLTQPHLLDDYLTNSWRFSPHNLLIEAHNLAQALDFLHHQMHTLNGKKLRCAHADLKPENVLVYFPHGKTFSDLPVGRWMICDFGLAKVEEVFTKTTVLAVETIEQEASKAPGDITREISITPRRGPGPFQPPEVYSADTAKVTTRRDVWSFGCILAMVLAFALNGPTGVEEQSRERASGADTYFYQRTRGSRARLSLSDLPLAPQNHVDAQLKPSFVRWLKDAPTMVSEHHRDRHSDWIKFCTKLIADLLNVDVLQRPEINRATGDLSAIITWTDDRAQDRLWDFADGIEPVSNIPILEQTISRDASSVYIGVSPTSPSSSHDSHAAIRQPPTSRSPKSQASSGLSKRHDPYTRYTKVFDGVDCQGTSLDSSGSVAVAWSQSKVHVSLLSRIEDSSTHWTEVINARGDLLNSCVGSSCLIELDNASKVTNVLTAGSFVGILTHVNNYVSLSRELWINC